MIRVFGYLLLLSFYMGAVLSFPHSIQLLVVGLVLLAIVVDVISCIRRAVRSDENASSKKANRL